MMEKCPDIMDLEAALLLPEDNPTRQHVLQCGQCLAILESLKAFDFEGAMPGDDEVPGLQPENLVKVQEDLDNFLVREIGQQKPAAVVSFQAKRSRFKPQAWMGIAAALVAVFGLWNAVPVLQEMNRQQPVLRGEETLQANKLELVSASRDSVGSLVLKWLPMAGATQYVTVFWNDELEEFSRLQPVESTTATIGLDSLPDSHEAVYFSVVALDLNKELCSSSLMEIPLY